MVMAPLNVITWEWKDNKISLIGWKDFKISILIHYIFMILHVLACSLFPSFSHFSTRYHEVTPDATWAGPPETWTTEDGWLKGSLVPKDCQNRRLKKVETWLESKETMFCNLVFFHCISMYWRDKEKHVHNLCYVLDRLRERCLM